MTKNYNDLGVEFKYLIVNDMDQKFGLWVNTVGFQSIQPDSPYPLKDHPSGYFFNAQKGRVLREYQLVYITKGRGLFSSETTPEKQVCKGRLMVLFPGQWHTYHPYRQTGWNEYYIGFEGPVIDNLVKGGFLSKDNQVLEVGLNEELVSLFSRALEIAEADKISSQQYLGGIVLHIVGMILSISKNKIFEVGDVDDDLSAGARADWSCGGPGSCGAGGGRAAAGCQSTSRCHSTRNLQKAATRNLFHNLVLLFSWGSRVANRTVYFMPSSAASPLFTVFVRFCCLNYIQNSRPLQRLNRLVSVSF